LEHGAEGEIATLVSQECGEELRVRDGIELALVARGLGRGDEGTKNVSGGVLTQLILTGVAFVAASAGAEIAGIQANVLVMLGTVAVAVITAGLGIVTYRTQRRVDDERRKLERRGPSPTPTDTPEGRE
jgi:hypothetical protein